MVFLCDKPYENQEYSFEEFSFPLSDFQKYAIEGIQKGQHVLVTAHTGSGKTLPAEFAIQHFVSRGKKVIYTSPIKALSNQKFYDFTQKYPAISFGLLTGDIKTNPTADVLIMTTEILMNALFSNQKIQSELSFQMDIDNDLGCVIFDEVHYINDSDRGQTWEQTILMLPLHIQMVMLSATIDNPIGFAEWIEQRDEKKNKQVYLASTHHRVVPLTHYGYFATTETPFKLIKDKTIQQQIRDQTNKLVLLKTANGKFVDEGLTTLSNLTKLFHKHEIFIKRKFVLNKLVEHLKEKEMLPAIVFVFSRKAVEQCAKEITTNLLEDDSKIPYTVANECEQIIRRFPNYKEYLELPEYIELVGLLEKGIGIHHSGMIPVLREIVEWMISKKYIKLLFATESFAIGLDCPIKTAVFSAMKKYDGKHFRYLLPHEYTQMAGRAGRRGIDTVGHVVHCNNLFDLPSLPEYNTILCGKPQKLKSKFKLSYPLVLNIIKHRSSSPTISSENNTTFESFVSKTLLSKELDVVIQTTQANINEQIMNCNKKEENTANLRTPLAICKEYLVIQQNLSMYTAKKQKELQKQIKIWKDEYRFFLSDVEQVKSFQDSKIAIEESKKELDYIQNYTSIHIHNVCNLLEESGFIQNNEFTEEGIIASHLHEIHPLLGSDLVKRSSFMTYSPQYIASILSIFTDISIPDDQRRIRPPDSLPDFLKTDISIIQSREEFYAKEELERGLYSPHVHFTYDIMDIIIQWCDLTTEQECKYFIQTKLKDSDISLGDFTKAVLKIIVIVKELYVVAEFMNHLSFLTSLKEIEPLLLKYIATNQSLYI